MTQQLVAHNTTESISELPTELESTSSKLVYLFLRSTGECTVDELQSSLDMKKISLYPLLTSLSKKGLVDNAGETYRLA